MHESMNTRLKKTFRPTFVRSMENPNKNTLLVVLLSYKKVIPQYVHTVPYQYLVVRGTSSTDVQLFDENLPLLFEVAYLGNCALSAGVSHQYVQHKC